MMAGVQGGNGTRSAVLDAVRGVAILQVLVWHYWVPGFLHSKIGGARVLAFLLNMSWTGVDLFFVLSGFLIGGILLDHRDEPNVLPVFYIRRVLRIFPLYAFVLVPFLLGGGGNKPAYIGFMQNLMWAREGHWGPEWIGVTWSLAVEEQFYLILPAMIRFVPAARLPVLLLVLIALAPGARAVAWLGFGNAYACYMLMPCRMDALFAGVLVAWVVRDPRWRRRLGSSRALVGFSGVGFVLLLGCDADQLSPLFCTVGYSAVAVFYAAVVLQLALHPPGSGWPVRLLGWFGLHAYGIYLLHCPIELIVARQVATGLPGLIVATVLTLLAAMVSWRMVERPCIRLGHRKFRYGARPAAAPIAA
jgi:peptidoglycan/LPS O-acetylase OafA/YrhL